MILGLSCILSGEDFSRVSEITPMFYPGREDLIGREMVAAQNFCHMPVFIFGLLFFLIMTIFAFTLLNKYSAVFVTAFLAFNPFILNYSRYIHVDIFLWFFIALNLYFLYKAYISEKHGKKEKIYFALSAVSLGLAGASKLSFGGFIFLNIFILAKKYLQEIKKILKDTLKFNFEVENTNIKSLISITLISGTLLGLFFLLPFQLNPNNVLDVYSAYQSHSPGEAGIGFNLNIFGFFINNFLVEVNLLDLLLFFISLYTLVWLLINKKTKSETFVLYFFALLIISFVLFRALHFTRVAIPYLLSVILLMSLTFSNRKYSIFRILKINKKRIYFFSFIIIYVIYSFSIAFSSSPYFEYANPVVCKISTESCDPSLEAYASKDLGNFLNDKMQDDETFIQQPAELFFYSRPEQGLEDWNFYVAFTQQFGREPTLEEKIQLFRPNNRTVRYIIIKPNVPNRYQEQSEAVMATYEPNDKIILKEQEVYWIYDLENLIEK